MKTKLLSLLLALVAGISVSYSQWSAPVNLSPGTTSVGTNENAGQCIAVWGDTVRVSYSDRSTAFAKIMFNQSPDQGITWGTPVVLNSSHNCGFTAIACSGQNVHVVWMDSLGATRASYYKRSLDGGIIWQPTICLDSFTKFWPGIACVGNLVIATLNKDLSGNTEVFIKRSLDNGASWLAEQQISNATNRSEDPAINMLGNDVHLSWNDKRSGTMNIYYCHSADGGATWGAETALTSVDSYTSMVCLNGANVDVPHGIRVATFFDVDNSESNDGGSSFIPNQNLTNTSALSELYPFMVRDGQNMHCVYLGPGGTNYLHSADGGITWDAPVFISASGQPFIAYTGCTLHLIFTNAGHLNYMRNPTANCTAVGLSAIENTKNDIQVFPNPATNQLFINVPAAGFQVSGFKLYNTVGEVVYSSEIKNPKSEITLDMQGIQNGIYFWETIGKQGKVVICH